MQLMSLCISHIRNYMRICGKLFFLYPAFCLNGKKIPIFFQAFFVLQRYEVWAPYAPDF